MEHDLNGKNMDDEEQKKIEERPPDIHVLAVVVFYETKNNHRIFLEQTRN